VRVEHVEFLYHIYTIPKGKTKMLNGITGFLSTGTRLFAVPQIISQIDLWHSPTQALLRMEADRRVLLDETETEIVRQWAAMEMECAAKDSEDSLLRRRCDLVELKQRAAKLNRKKTRGRASLAW
jgi:hypothetical protein